MKFKRGFALLEIVIAISVMALLAAVAIPNLQFRSSAKLTQKFISDLNALSQAAWQDTIVTGLQHRVVFDFNSKVIFIEKEKASAVGKDLNESEAFEQISSPYVKGALKYPDHLETRGFFVSGEDEFEGKSQSWYFIAPNGITQEVLINMEDISKQGLGDPDVFGLVLNPFSAQFKKHETYQEPA